LLTYLTGDRLTHRERWQRRKPLDDQINRLVAKRAESFGRKVDHAHFSSAALFITL
jgi:hypothetical protein